jgi:hypothetical protein
MSKDFRDAFLKFLAVLTLALKSSLSADKTVKTFKLSFGPNPLKPSLKSMAKKCNGMRGLKEHEDANIMKNMEAMVALAELQGYITDRQMTDLGAFIIVIISC